MVHKHVLARRPFLKLKGDIVTVLEFSAIVDVTVVTINVDAATIIFENTGHVTHL